MQWQSVEFPAFHIQPYLTRSILGWILVSQESPKIFYALLSLWAVCLMRSALTGKSHEILFNRQNHPESQVMVNLCLRIGCENCVSVLRKFNESHKTLIKKKLIFWGDARQRNSEVEGEAHCWMNVPPTFFLNEWRPGINISATDTVFYVIGDMHCSYWAVWDRLKYCCIQPCGSSENRMTCVISVSIGQITEVLAQKKQVPEGTCFYLVSGNP